LPPKPFDPAPYVVAAGLAGVALSFVYKPRRR
jgi:hypothetical protein